MNIHDAIRDDDVTGQIVGMYYIAGRLYYQGRQQGPMLIAESDAGLAEQANAVKESLRQECGEAFSMIWPDRSGWELRIFQ